MPHAPLIIAPSTPPGRGLRAMIRISGNDAIPLLTTIIPSSPSPKPRTIQSATLRLPDLQPLNILLTTFAAPRSYTGEDIIELQLPANQHLIERVIEGILAAAAAASIPARRAEPGEFTARAFLNHKLSLTQAEGIAAAIAAESDAQLRAAHALLSNQLGETARNWADHTANALALVEAGIDFTDQDDVIAITRSKLHARLQPLLHEVNAHLSRSVGREQLAAIPWVVIAGQPNAGKSTLFNALLNRTRAVVSNTAGTTRDILAEPLTLHHQNTTAEVMLIDLAGLDDNPSALNLEMQHAAANAIARAELILFCTPAACGVATPAPTLHPTPTLASSPHSHPVPPSHACGFAPPPSDIPTFRRSDVPLPPLVLNVITKADLLNASSTLQPNDAILVSAHTNSGIDDLRQRIASTLSTRTVSLAADAVALQPRHDAALRDAASHLTQTINLLTEQNQQHHDNDRVQDPELIAASLRNALDAFAALAGDITPDDVLGRIFATFCIGK